MTAARAGLTTDARRRPSDTEVAGGLLLLGASGVVLVATVRGSRTKQAT